MKLATVKLVPIGRYTDDARFLVHSCVLLQIVRCNPVSDSGRLVIRGREV